MILRFPCSLDSHSSFSPSLTVLHSSPVTRRQEHYPGRNFRRKAEGLDRRPSVTTSLVLHPARPPGGLGTRDSGVARGTSHWTWNCNWDRGADDKGYCGVRGWDADEDTELLCLAGGNFLPKDSDPSH